MDVQKPIQVDRGYFEFRVNWDAADLMGMSGEQLENLQALVSEFESLAEGVNDNERSAQ